MTRTFSKFSAIVLSTFLFGCSSETHKETESTTIISATQNDTVSLAKTDTVPEVKTEIADKTATEAQPDSADFQRVLTFKNIAFSVKATGKGSLQDVTIQPSGLKATNRAETLKTEPITGAEVADLNADGHPELLIFTQSAGSGSYGKVIAFSVNNGRSMSRVTFPETSQDPELKKGYGGHDKFSVVNNTLTQEFPVYNEGDVNSKATGKKRIITYKLQDGEASRVFVVDQVKEVAVK